ncbi:MAG: hypothetical protein ABI630_10415 [Betaproteobacteria bacterium]
MADTFIHQICYSAQSRAELDPGFIEMDNLRNERPDWREYWPIRRFLLCTALQEDAYYGFFSPKFGAKTGLTAEDVFAFVAAQGGTADVVLFSPFFDQIAYPLNIFEQGAMQHADTMRTFREAALCAAPGIDFDALVMDSTNTVFCNFFAARPRFWREWLEKCEALYAVAEGSPTPLAARLNASTNHDGGGVPAKVFVIERIASLMLASGTGWKVKAFNAESLPWSGSPLGQFRLEMSFLDALKIAYAREGHAHYLAAFHNLRRWVGEALQPPRP